MGAVLGICSLASWVSAGVGRGQQADQTEMDSRPGRVDRARGDLDSSTRGKMKDQYIRSFVS